MVVVIMGVKVVSLGRHAPRGFMEHFAMYACLNHLGFISTYILDLNFYLVL